MPAPTVVTYDPANGTTNVPLNKVLRVTFDTALLSTTVSSNTFALRHSSTSMPARVTVSLDSTGTIVTIIPTTLLIKNSSYTLRVIGVDLALPGGNVEASDGTDYATTTEVTFVTGDDIDVSDGQKTNEEQEVEGDLRLPSGLKATSLTTFQVVKTTPKDHSWGFTGSTITIEFNRNVASSSTTGNINLYQGSFLDEPGWIARSGTNGWAFEWNTSSWSSESADFFTLPTWDISTSGKYVTLTATGVNYTGNTFRNIKYELDITDQVMETGGSYLRDPTTIYFTSQSYPNYVTPRAIRGEIYSVFEDLNLDFVHEITWKSMIEAYKLSGYADSQLTSKGIYLRRYVTCSVVLDIMKDMFLNKARYAGIMKTLGDFIVEYHPQAGDIGKNSVLKSLEEKLKAAERAINYKASTARIFIKGWTVDSPNLRNRLWKNPNVLSNTDGNPLASDWPVANTAEERKAKLPGQYDSWS